MPLKPAQGVVGRYIARKSDGHWIVVFGRFSETEDAFLIVYEAIQGSSPKEFSIKTYDHHRKTADSSALPHEGFKSRWKTPISKADPTTRMFFHWTGGEFYVYILPAQTTADVYPHGGDTRYLLSADGSQIIETRQLHKTILENKREPSSDTKTVAGYHTHILTDTPEDTDVFHVLRQSPPLPEYVGTKSDTYVVNADGTIKRVK